MRLRRSLGVIAIACLLVTSGCGGYEVTPPEALDDGWIVAEPEAVGLDDGVIRDLFEHVASTPERAVHAVLIVKDGTLVVEEYFDGYRFDYDDPRFEGDPVSYGPDVRQNLMSVTKAVTAAATGIAVADGAIPDVETRVLDALPTYRNTASTEAQAITVEHLLTMTSGLEWNEWDVPITDTENNDLIRLFMVDDPVGYVLSKPVTHEPGTWWYYSGGDVNVLGEVIEEYVAMPIDVYAAERLFSPLGITDYQWRYLNPEVVCASGELELRPRDLAKFGYLFLNDGSWNGVEILDPEWVTATLTNRVSTRGLTSDGGGYGYQWFAATYPLDDGSIEAFVRTGWGGQVLAVFPTLDMEVVITSGDYVLATNAEDLITDYILPAVDPHSD